MQASGDLKLAKLRQLQCGEVTLSKHSLASTIVQVEPDGEDPQIGYRALPQKSWYALCCLASRLFACISLSTCGLVVQLVLQALAKLRAWDVGELRISRHATFGHPQTS